MECPVCAKIFWISAWLVLYFFAQYAISADALKFSIGLLLTFAFVFIMTGFLVAIKKLCHYAWIVSVTTHMAQEPIQNDKNNDGAQAAATPFGCTPSGKYCS
jgi:hypothetical protein